MELELRKYQQDALDMVRSSLAAGNERTVLTLPTGGGKTEIAVGIAKLGREKSNAKTWFIVDRKTLAHQARARFQKYGMRCGLMQGENTDLRHDDEAVVATIQSLNSRFEKNPLIYTPDVVIIDECHVLHDMHIKLMEYRNAPTIGLTATPSNPVLGKYFTDMVVPVTMGQLIEAGQLVPFRAFAPTEPDLEGVRFQRGDFVESDLEERMTAITGDIVEHWKRLGENRQTIAFCVNVQHARELAAQFESDGVPAAMVYAGTPDEEREDIYRRLADGTLKVCTSVLVLGVGFDLPEVSCAILARPTASEALHVQQCGRVARLHDGKVDALLLDHAGNTVRHGLPQHYQPPELGEGEKRTRKERTPKEKRAVRCTNCGALMEPGQQHCGGCGIKRQAISDVVTVDGRLVEIDLEHESEVRENTTTFRKRFFKELKGYAELNGYKQGWAVHQYQERYSNLPWEDGTIARYNAILSEHPSEETCRWIDNRKKYHRIRNAKSNARP